MVGPTQQKLTIELKVKSPGDGDSWVTFEHDEVEKCLTVHGYTGLELEQWSKGYVAYREWVCVDTATDSRVNAVNAFASILHDVLFETMLKTPRMGSRIVER